MTSMGFAQQCLTLPALDINYVPATSDDSWMDGRLSTDGCLLSLLPLEPCQPSHHSLQAGPELGKHWVNTT